ncbi:sterol carrier protein 2-like [Anthonomus grandis grandis]|uniref:sterol carrier protein 2-like n=1 Tax=Anthonomus grandis grandis TaxID=2921223 RepID=UPI002165B989|nr:sterol carrier protein 2-like [Anthonomus grandis grandis]
MVRVFVIGVSMTKFDKPGTKPGDYPDWGKEAILGALRDANVGMEQVELATAGFVYGDSTSGQRVIYEVGMTGIPIFNVNNNCSTGSTALMLAKELVECGKAQCALAVGWEKMQRGSLGATFMDRANPMEKHIEVMSELVEMDASPITAQMFGNAAIEHMKKYGTKPEHFAKIGWKNHKHSVNNPNSQFRDEYSLEQIMKSPTVYGPLTKLQCCPTSDGAAAAIIASEDFVRKHGLEARAVEILGMEMCTDLESTFKDKSCIKIVGYDMVKIASERMFRKTGKRPTDVQVVELHDCFSANELITYEALGLCPPGGAGSLIDRGDNTYGGKYVINPSGGLISKGHPLGATGLAQCAELVWQLRGEAGPRQVPNAKLALQHNIGLGGAVVVALYQMGFPEYNNRRVVGSKLAGSTNEDDFIATPYLKILQQAMLEDEDGLIEKHRGIYGLKVQKDNGEEGFWVINATQGKGKIEFNGKDKPQVTFIVKEADILDLLTGKIQPQRAYFQGKVKVSGNMGLAMRLTELQRTAAPKIEALRAKHLKSKL